MAKDVKEEAFQQQALADLHAEFHGQLVSYFRHPSKDPASAEDLAQHVFERLAKRGSLDTIDNPKAYLFQTARSVFADHLRARASRHTGSHEVFDETKHADVELGADHVMIQRERLELALAAIEALPDRTRAIFMLRRLEGVKYKEIASGFGISVSAVEKHMERAVRAIAKKLDRI